MRYIYGGAVAYLCVMMYLSVPSKDPNQRLNELVKKDLC